VLLLAAEPEARERILTVSELNRRIKAALEGTEWEDKPIEEVIANLDSLTDVRLRWSPGWTIGVQPTIAPLDARSTTSVFAASEPSASVKPLRAAFAAQ
jgi:hypothetical protein